MVQYYFCCPRRAGGQGTRRVNPSTSCGAGRGYSWVFSTSGQLKREWAATSFLSNGVENAPFLSDNSQ